MRKNSLSFSQKSSIPSRQSLTRSATPNDIGNDFKYNPYPLYKQKIRALLKPPDYSRNPPVFMSGREPRSEFERKEASTQVKLLKKTFNNMYQMFNSYDKNLNMLKSEAIRVNALRSVGENDLETLQNKIDLLETQENVMLSRIKQELDNNLMCKHVRERMRQTLMYLEVKNQYFQDQIRLKDFLIESEQRKRTKTLENKFTSMQAYKQLKKTVNLDVKDRSQDLFILQEDIQAREKIHELRKNRIKKYEEIAETAANEERDLKNNKMRESVLINAMWAQQLNMSLQLKKKKNLHIEQAFEKIKTYTLIKNVEEVLSKFLLKEDRLKEMMNNLNRNKQKCIDFIQKNDMIETKIDEFFLTQKTNVDVNVNDLRSKIHEKIIKIGTAKERLKKTKLIVALIKEWGAKRLEMISGDKGYGNWGIQAIYQTLCKTVKQAIRTNRSSSFITELN
jgi:hypothetical protein